MANEDQTKWGTAVTLTSTGGALTSGSTVGIAGSTFDLQSQSPADYPHVKFTLTITFATSTNIENKVVELIAREIDVDGTTDEDAPTSTFKRVVAVFPLKGVTSAQTVTAYLPNAPRKAEYYLFTECGQNASANWKLIAQPYSYGPL
jgi:hypothetical protein